MCRNPFPLFSIPGQGPRQRLCGSCEALLVQIRNHINWKVGEGVRATLVSRLKSYLVVASMVFEGTCATTT